MPDGHIVIFHPFRLDLANEKLWQGTQEIPLRPKTFAVLRHLVTHAGQLVSKNHLLDAVWGDTTVSDVVPIVCIRELRKALGDEVEAPRFIETRARRGYRFIAAITTTAPQTVTDAEFRMPMANGVGGSELEESFPSPLASSLQPHSSLLVGRRGELAQLYSLWKKAVQGDRQIVFVSGEAGIGKTALVETFLAQVRNREGLGAPNGRCRTPNSEPLATPWIGHGQCIEHHGSGEAYLPLLDITGRLCREPGGERLVDILRQYAPTWFMQLPGLLNKAEDEELQRKTTGATRERMLREMAEAVEIFTAKCPEILVLEDLHWCDYATLDFLAFLARRREPARLLVIGTYRPAEGLRSGHPLATVTEELARHRHCVELPLTLLSEAEVQAYLGARLPRLAQDEFVMQQIATLLHRRTEGNPLFLTNVVDYLRAQDVDVLQGASLPALEQLLEVVPENIQQMVEKQIDRLSQADQGLLEVASVAGVAFSAATVAAAMGLDVVDVENQCRELSRYGRFLRRLDSEEWQDGTVATRYGFIHTLYHQVLYERVTSAQQSRLHQRIGERLEQGYGTTAPEKAAELAQHFTRGRDTQRAVQYLHHAAMTARRRFAFQEVRNYCRKALELIHQLPETPERMRKEIALLSQMVGSLMALKGESAPEVEATYARIIHLYQQLPESEPPFAILFGLWAVQIVRGNITASRALAEQLFSRAKTQNNSLARLWAHHALGISLLYQGELKEARHHLQDAAEVYDKVSSPCFMFDPRMTGLALDALALWLLGYPQQALSKCECSLTWAREQAQPYSETFILSLFAWLQVNRRDGDTAQTYLAALLALAREHNFAMYIAAEKCFRGAAYVVKGETREGIPLMAEGIAALQSHGAGLGMSAWLVLYAAALGNDGRAEEGLAILAEAEALVAQHGESFYLAEVARTKGELLLQKFHVSPATCHVPSDPQHGTRHVHDAAEAFFLQALDVARRHGAKTFELRAATSLGRLWRAQGRIDEAYVLLDGIYSWFSEGFETVDLQEAQALLEELGNLSEESEVAELRVDDSRGEVEVS
ncbi:MAG: AAA family ATPase [Candidatus Binatia bacterium]